MNLESLVLALTIAAVGGLASRISADEGKNAATETPKKQTLTLEQYKQNYPIEKIKELESELEKNPTSDGYVHLSDLYFVTKREDLSFKAANRAVDLDNKNAYALNNLGSAYAERDDYKSAELYLSQANKIRPNDGHILSNLGFLYLRKGENEKNTEDKKNYFKESEKYSQAAIDANINQKNAYINLARVSFLQGKLGRSLELYKKVCELYDLSTEEHKNSVQWVTYLNKELNK